MTEILQSLRRGDAVPGLEPELRWAWLTLALSSLVVVGYVAITVRWFIQSRVARSPDGKAALARLGAVVLLCGAGACWFSLADMSWPAWRVYDGALLAVALYTCWFAVRMRGWRAVDERLARVEALEQAAGRYRRLAVEKEALARHKTFLLNSLSHDLRAPLNIVALNAQILEGAAHEPRQVESAKVITENAMAAGELLTKLLEVARAGGQDANAMAAVSVTSLVQQVARRFQPAAERKGLALRVSVDDDLRIVTDRQKLERVVGNLLDNAIKFTDHGGVTLEAARNGDAVRIQVTDTGPGVPPESAAYLFDQFYQVQGGGAGKDNGFGMGLAICRNLARQLGGDVRLARTGPDGSCFEVTVRGQRATRATWPEVLGGRRAEHAEAGFSPPEADAPAKAVSRR